MTGIGLGLRLFRGQSPYFFLSILLKFGGSKFLLLSSSFSPRKYWSGKEEEEALRNQPHLFGSALIDGQGFQWLLSFVFKHWGPRGWEVGGVQVGCLQVLLDSFRFVSLVSSLKAATVQSSRNMSWEVGATEVRANAALALTQHPCFLPGYQRPLRDY